MVDLLIGNSNIEEANMLCNLLANDKNYMIKSAKTATETLSTYMNSQPNILVLDSNFKDMSLNNIMKKLSCSPVENMKCNIVLTAPSNYPLILDDVAKINKILYKPILDEQFVQTIETMSNYFNITEIENAEIDNALQLLNISSFSEGYKYMKEAISYCYYNPNELEFLNNIHEHIAFKFNVSKDKVKNCMTSCIRPFNNSQPCINITNDLYKKMYENTSYKLSPKKFLEKLVLYFIQKKGRPL